MSLVNLCEILALVKYHTQ